MPFGDYVQSVGVDSGSGVSAALAYGSNNAASGLLFLVARFATAPGAITVTDTRGNTWLALGNILNSNGAIVYYVLSAAAGANTVTLQNGNSVGRRWALLEYVGPGVLDDSDSGTSFFDSPTTPALTTTVATELLFLGLATGGDATFTPGTSWTTRVNVGNRLVGGDRLVTSTGNYTPNYGIGGEQLWIMIAGGFSAVAATQNPAEWMPMFQFPRRKRRVVAF